MQPVDPRLAKAIAACVRERRVRQGWRQVELASRARVDRPVLSRLERGEHVPSLQTLQNIVRPMRTTLSRLFADVERQLRRRTT